MKKINSETVFRMLLINIEKDLFEDFGTDGIIDHTSRKNYRLQDLLLF